MLRGGWAVVGLEREERTVKVAMSAVMNVFEKRILVFVG